MTLHARFFVRQVLALCLALTGLISAQAQVRLVSGDSEGTQSRLERETFAQVNQYRKSEGLPPFAWDAEIARIARIHSRDMAEGAVDFGHDGFDGRVSRLRQVLLRLSGCAENVLMTSDPHELAWSAVALWLKSSPHLHNIRGDYSRSAIGIWESRKGVVYFTEMFVRLRPFTKEALL